MCARVSLEWKDTTTRLDLNCECGACSHYDASFAFVGSVKCTACDEVWILSPVIEARRARIGNPLDSYRIEAADLPTQQRAA